MSAIIERTPAVIAGEINYIKRQAQQTLLAASVEIGRLEEENEEAERDYNSAADELEEKQKALQDALKGKRDAEAMFNAAKKLADANAKEKDKAVKAKAAAEKKEADLMKQLNDATEEIRRLEAEAQEKPEPEQITMEAAVSEEALEAQREKIAEEERAKIREEYERKLAAAANPDAQRAAMHMESMINSYNALKKTLERLPDEMREKIVDRACEAISKMEEGLRDE